jgi:hypothetical protein
MKNAQGTIDWNATEEYARRIGSANLHYAIQDILDTLPVADELDRADDGDRGGYYRDELSVFRKVQKELA